MVRHTVTVAGIGLQSTATADQIIAALDMADPARKANCLVVLDEKAHLLPGLAIPVQTLAASSIWGVATLTQSTRIQEKFGTGSVCEALALVAAGPDALLDGPRIISPDRLVTVALATGRGKE